MAYDGGINSLLQAMPQGQPICDDFGAAVIGDRNIEIHVSHAKIRIGIPQASNCLALLKCCLPRRGKCPRGLVTNLPPGQEGFLVPGAPFGSEPPKQGTQSR